MLMLFIVIIIYSSQRSNMSSIIRRHHNHQVFPTISGSDYILYNHDIVMMRMPVQRNAYIYNFHRLADISEQQQVIAK